MRRLPPGRDLHEPQATGDTMSRVHRDRGMVAVGSLVVAATLGYGSKGDLLESVRERTPDEWWLRAAAALGASTPEYPLWEGARGLVSYLDSDEPPVAVLPGELLDRMADAMFDAARAAAFEVLMDWCRQVVPVLDAIKSQSF